MKYILEFNYEKYFTKITFQLIILGFIFTNTLFAESEEVIDVKEAYKHIGETKIVCGRIVSTKYLKKSSGGPIF